MHIPDARRKKPLISLTSLIDVVFILLVFFMLSSSFLRWNTIDLGIGDSGEMSLELTEQSFIHVDFNQQYKLNDRTMLLENIIVAVKQQISQQPKHPILIQPVDALPLQQLVTVLDAVGAIAKDNISLVKDES